MHEVSNRILTFYVDAAARVGVDVGALTEGLPSIVRAQAGEPWYDWDEHVTMAERFERVVGGPARAEQLAAEAYSRPLAAPYRVVARFLTTIGAVYRAGFSWFGKGLYRGVSFDYRALEGDRFELSITLPESFRPSELFFRMWRAGLRGTPCMLGLAPAAVEASWSSHRAVYQVIPPPGRDVWSRVRRRWFGFWRPEALVAEMERHQERERTAYEALLHAQESERRIGEELKHTEEWVGLGRAVGGIVHELSNPLTFLAGSLDLASNALEQVAAAPAKLPAAKRSVDDARTALAHLREVLQALRATYAPTSAQPSPVDVHEVLDASVRFASTQIAATAKLTRALEKSPRVLANAARLTQVFLNLLLNAAQAFERPSPDNEIQVSVRPEGDAVVVEISDNGSGYDAARLDGDERPLSTKPQGTGMGLSICTRLVTEMGGAFELRQRPTGGTTARLRFPQAAVAPEASVGRASKRLPSVHGRHVLIVDDQPNFVKTTRLLLDGAHVQDAGSVRDALEKLGAQRFDVVLCDIAMPQASGLSLYETLAKSQPGEERKVIFVTGGLVDEEARAFVHGRGVKCLLKPFTQDELLQAVSEV